VFQIFHGVFVIKRAPGIKWLNGTEKDPYKHWYQAVRWLRHALSDVRQSESRDVALGEFKNYSDVW